MFRKKTESEIKKVVTFTAGELIEILLKNEGEEKLDNNQKMYDMACDLMKDYDLSKIVLDRLRKILKVK